MTPNQNLIDLLKTAFASNFHLYLKTHTAHFNVTGMFFESLHSLFNGQYEDLQDQIDAYGEQLRRLDHFVPGSLVWISESSLFDDFSRVLSSKDYVQELLSDHEQMIELLNELFTEATTANEQALANYVAERLDAHKKSRWMLRTSLNPVVDK